MEKLFVLFASLIALLACNKEADINKDDGILTPVTITAKYGDDTKVSFSENGNAINASWQSGDKLYVLFEGHVNILDLVSGEGTSTATFSGNIVGTPKSTNVLNCFVKDQNNPDALTVDSNGNLVFNDDAFFNQDGTVGGAAKCNTYSGFTTYGNGTNLTVCFTVNTSILKLTVIPPGDAVTGEIAALTYWSGNEMLASLLFNVDYDSNTVYLAVPAGQYIGEQTLRFHCPPADAIITLSTSRANFLPGQTYSKEIDYFDPYATPLTFQAMAAGVHITVPPNVWEMYYSLNGGEWTRIIGGSVYAENVGDKISFRGWNSSLENSYFDCSGDFSIYGNIMSLLDGDDYPTATTITATNAFLKLFKGNFSMYNHPFKKLVLPATTLSEGCYRSMFEECFNLTSAPELPATTLAASCYERMFSLCRNLTTPPKELPATTLQTACCKEMFSDCHELTSAPKLPATTLAESCYKRMFYQCNHLAEAPELPATTMAASCYEEMFYKCSQLEDTPELPATTLANSCYKGMFYGCSGILGITLPATDLVSDCYNSMFTNCSRVYTIGTYALVNSETNYLYTDNWLNGVAGWGVFCKAKSATWCSGPSGIPAGWEVSSIY